MCSWTVKEIARERDLMLQRALPNTFIHVMGRHMRESDISYQSHSSLVLISSRDLSYHCQLLWLGCLKVHMSYVHLWIDIVSLMKWYGSIDHAKKPIYNDGRRGKQLFTICSTCNELFYWLYVKTTIILKKLYCLDISIR